MESALKKQQPEVQDPKVPRPQEEKVESPWREALRMFFRNKLAVVGTVIIFIFVLMAILSPLLFPAGVDNEVLSLKLQAPSSKFWFGTDDFGRSILARVAYGARISLSVGVAAVIGSITVGTLLGVLAGYYGKTIDTVISRIFDIMLAFPSILLAIAIVAVLGPSLINALIAIMTVNIPNFGRVVRSRVISLKEEEFITAARSIGMRDRRILFHHILPNSLAPIIVQGTLAIGTAILDAAALGFLGLGAQPPNPEWGKMLSDSKDFITQAPWTVLFPGLAIMLTVLGFNLMGDGLRDALDPRMKN